MRIVSLQPSVSIILDRLGGLDHLVACTRYCLAAVPGLRERQLPIVSDSWSTTAEELRAIQPDLVIASVPYREESLGAILRAGYPVLALAPHSLSDIEKDIRLIAAVAGGAEGAEALITGMRNDLSAVRGQTATAHDKPSVYCEEWGKPPIHSQIWVKELVEAAGGRFVGEPGSRTTFEAIAEADPDIVIAAWCGAGDRVPLEKLAARPGWEGMRAVQAGRVYCVPDEWLNTPGPTLMEGLRALASVLQPELFSPVKDVRSLNRE